MTTNDFILLVFASLACFRLTRLVTDDKITDWFRSSFVRQMPRPAKAKARQGIECPFCVSFYVAIGLTVYLYSLYAFPWREAFIWQAAIWGGSVLLNQLFVRLSK